MDTAFAGHGRTVIALVAACPLLIGCSELFEPSEPEAARVVIEGASGHALELITTSDFDVVRSMDGETREIYVFSADTADVVSPVDRTYRLVPRTRFYMIVSSEMVPDEPVTVRVYIDHEERYRRVTSFGDEVVEFVYSFK